MHVETSPLRFRHTRLFLAVSMLVMGICGIVYEYVLGLMGNNLVGSSYEQIFVVIGIMMFAMGIGAAAQRALVRDLIDWFLRLELLLGLIGGFGALLTYLAFVYMVSYVVALYALAFIIGALIGLEMPLLIRINSTYAGSLRANLGDILTMDYVGSLVGALFFTYVLLTRVSIPRIGLVMGCTNVSLAWAGLFFFRPLIRRPRLLLGALVVVSILLAVGLAFSDRWVTTLEQRCFEDPIEVSLTSRYQHIVVTRRNDRTRLYLNGNLQFDGRDEYIYHEQLVHVPISVAGRHQRVLILGGGDGLALREVLRYDDVVHVTLVDIDPEMIALARTNPLLARLNEDAFRDARVQASVAPAAEPGGWETVSRPSSLAESLLALERYELGRVEVYTVDADNFVRQAGGVYDVVLIDLPDPRTVELAKLYSLDFYRALERRLAPGAVLSVQSTSPYRAREVFLCIGETLREAGYQALPYRDYLPSFGDWGWYLAWRDGPDPAGMRERLERVEAFPVPTRYLTPEVMHASFVFGRGALEVPPDLRPNSKMRPVLTAYYKRGFE